MNRKPLTAVTLMVLTAISGVVGRPAQAAQQGGVLPLRHGIYVHDTTACAGAPFAEMQDYAGDGIGSPHSRACHARIVTHDGNAVTIDNSCLDAGEGSAARVRERMTLRIEGSDRYALLSSGESFTYRWCEPMPEGRG